MEITIKTKSSNMGWHFNVVVTDELGQSFHNVSMDKDFLSRVSAQTKPEKVVEKSFEFLLERESKEEILQEFDITTISQNFPEFISELEKKLVY